MLTLTGWVALAAMFGLATAVLGGVVYGLRRWSGHRGYTMVRGMGGRGGSCGRGPRKDKP